MSKGKPFDARTLKKHLNKGGGGSTVLIEFGGKLYGIKEIPLARDADGIYLHSLIIKLDEEHPVGLPGYVNEDEGPDELESLPDDYVGGKPEDVREPLPGELGYKGAGQAQV